MSLKVKTTQRYVFSANNLKTLGEHLIKMDKTFPYEELVAIHVGKSAVDPNEILVVLEREIPSDSDE